MPLKGVLAREKPLARGQAALGNSAASSASPRPDIEEIEYIRAFVWKPRWFVLSQTQPLDPESVQPLAAPVHNEWSADVALATLQICFMPFSSLDGKIQGMAQGRSIAVSPLAALPQKTFFHEMAHVVLSLRQSPFRRATLTSSRVAGTASPFRQ